MNLNRILALVKIQFKKLFRSTTDLFVIVLLPIALVLAMGLAFGSIYVTDYGWTDQDGYLFQFMLPGLIALSGLFMAITVSLSFSEDREQGLLKRMNTTPTTSGEFMVSNLISNMTLAMLQVALVFICCAILGFIPTSSAGGIALTFVFMAVLSLSSIGFGLITATIVKSPSSAGGFVWLFILPQQLIAAGLYPLPPETKYGAMFMPLYYASDGLTLLFNQPLTDFRIWGDLLVLALYGLAIFLAGILLFQKYGKD